LYVSKKGSYNVTNVKTYNLDFLICNTALLCMIIASGVVIWGKDKMDVEKELNGT
jgi:hypothetical protein